MKSRNSISRNWSYILLMALAVLIATVLWIFIYQYTRRFQTTFNNEAHTYMMEIAQQVTLVMNERVNTNLLHLQSDAAAIEAIGEQSNEQMVEYLNDEAERFGYTQMSLANVNGISTNSLGDVYNVSNRLHYLAALKGELAVSEVISYQNSNADCFEYAVPVYKDGEISGVLMAGFTLDTFRDVLQVNMFQQQGNAIVVDGQGIVVVDNSEVDNYNFFHLLKKDTGLIAQDRERFIEDVTLGNSGTIDYTNASTRYMMYYQPLGINDWSILVSVPADIVTHKTDLFLQGIAYISAVIALLIATLMMILVYMQYHNRMNLEKILFLDPITGGATQAKFEIEANKLIAGKEPGSYALVQMNLQKFKLINTTFGREAGDRTLRHIYNTMVHHLRTDELAARFSADKFGLLLQFYSKEEFENRLSALCVDINSFNNKLTKKYILQFEQGICLVNEVGLKFAVAFERANFALRHGDKRNAGQNNVSFYIDVERSVIMREKEIENCMEQALKNGEFQMYLQPKYELTNDTVGGAEALVRWQSPEKGMIFPDDFIPLFERNGFVVRLDLYMFEQVCKLQQKWKDIGVEPVPISVNLSRVHLNDLNFLDKYREVFDRFDFPAELVEIELTESTVFDDVEQLCDIIYRIKQIGFTCSLDDFGSGYSSLNLLKDIPVDTIKLDRSFFYSKSGDETKSRYVVENMVDLARKLDMHTVSEGIETMEMVEYLRSVKCDMVQGYVFAKPMPISEFEKLIYKPETKSLE